MLRLFGAPDSELVVSALRTGELEAALAAQGALADPGNRAADELWWNWCRTPAGVSAADALRGTLGA